MLQTDCMIWLIPATRKSWDSGANKGMDACMEGMWKADPTERNASNVYIAHTSACPK